MAKIIASIFQFLLLIVATGVASADDGVRVLSWNISDDAFATEQVAFQSLLIWANPDLILLDEVSPTVDQSGLLAALATLRPDKDENWIVDTGVSGGRQRGLIASRYPLRVPPEFSGMLAYPEEDKRKIFAAMSRKDRKNPDWSMENGIPVHGAIVTIGDRRLLAVTADLQCCGDTPDSWQEYRRRAEIRQIRERIREVLENNAVDAVIFAGDFNMVNSTFPLALLAGPYVSPHDGLIPAEIYHPDGVSSWTWDGRSTPFPSNTLDYQLYGPHALRIHTSLVLDTEKLSAEFLQATGLQRDTSSKTGRHRPLLVEYKWNE